MHAMCSFRCVALLIAGVVSAVSAATVQERYYAHKAVHDQHGVIAPWYTGTNGQIDERIRVAVAMLKRYPWTPAGKAPRSLPEYIYSGAWHIDAEGNITIPEIGDWANGDLAQRAAYILGGLIDYYRYSGDPWAKEVVALQADALLDFALTPDDHDWPRFLISVPLRGKPYGHADPHGLIQLDIAAEVGIVMVRAAQLCGNDRYMEAARHWADLLAAKRLREPGVNPWPRYANPQDAPWEDIATGGVAFILEFFDELIRNGYSGENGALVAARTDGIAYLRDVLLPNWLEHDVWGRNYWDWACDVQVENVTEFVCRYMMDHPDEFPNWRSDTRNILTLFINRTCVSSSNGDTFSGAWAYPESSGCCGRSLWYGPLELAPVYAQYAAVLSDADQPRASTRAGMDTNTTVAWAREMARRQMILATYDFLPTGVVEDGIDGGPVVAGDWFKIAHPMVLKHCLNAIAWMPEVFAPAHEAHIVRSTHTVVDVQYEHDSIRFKVAGPPDAKAATVLWVPFKSDTVKAEVAGASAPMRVKHAPADAGVLVFVEHAPGTTVIVTGTPLDKPATSQPCTLAGDHGPIVPQRWIFGYPHREDYVDSAGNAWRPATEWVVRAGNKVDCVAAAWLTQRRQLVVAGTSDPELYRYGAQFPEFWADFTVGPGNYQVRLLFAEHRWNAEPETRATSILINGREVVSGMDIAATAAQAAGIVATQPEQMSARRSRHHGLNRAVDLVFENVKPENGIVSIRFKGINRGRATVQAIELTAYTPTGEPGDEYRLAGHSAIPVPVQPPVSAAPATREDGNLLANGNFEEGGPKDLGALGKTGSAAGWNYTFASAGQAYLWIESDYIAHPDCGLPEYHDGKQAVRTHADRGGHTLLWQEVRVKPGTTYTASAWIRAADLQGEGFGTNPCDSAGLIVEELDGQGRVIHQHPKQAVSSAGDYRKLQLAFETRPSTARVRFILEAVQAGNYRHGHVTFDNCRLTAVASEIP